MPAIDRTSIASTGAVGWHLIPRSLARLNAMRWPVTLTFRDGRDPAISKLRCFDF
jgi:hypothetical protein